MSLSEILFFIGPAYAVISLIYWINLTITHYKYRSVPRFFSKTFFRYTFFCIFWLPVMLYWLYRDYKVGII